MLIYNYPNGHEIFVERVSILRTYSGCLEGTPETNSPYIREGLGKQIARLMPPGEPLLILDEQRVILPDWLWAARFFSRRGVQHNDPDYNSELYVSWFTEKIGKNLTAELRRVLKQIDWESSARDYDICNF